MNTKEKVEKVSAVIDFLMSQSPDIIEVREIAVFALAGVLSTEPIVHELTWGQYALRISRMLFLSDSKVAHVFQKHDIEFSEFLEWKKSKS